MIKSKAVKAGRLEAALNKARAEKQLGEQWFNESMNTQDVKQLATFTGIDFDMVDYWAHKAAHDEAASSAKGFN